MADRTPPAPTFQDMILRLYNFWAEQGCVIGQPFDVEKGAGTYNPHTFLRALGPEPWKVAYVEPSRRPTDGRYGDNPNRLYRHHQFQVILKPSPQDVQELYLRSMQAIGIHPEEHDIRFVEDNWESPTLGAWGLGWEVWVDGMELTQFTYFQQCGGFECRPVSAELTYGLERIAMYLQAVDDVYDLTYAPGITYREIFHQDEVEYSTYTFEHLDVPMYLELYESCEKETSRLVEHGLVIPAYDHLLRASHAFNSLDARGAISVTERQGYILRIRDLSKLCAEGYLALREKLGFPLGKAKVAPLREAEPTTGSTGKKGELFVEIGSEELPAAEVLPAVNALKEGILSRLKDLRLAHGEARVLATPRRLAVILEDVALNQEDRTLEVAGPPVRAAFKDGQPTKAAIGFAKGQGVSVDQLVRKETKKGEYVYAVIEEQGQETKALLPRIIEESIAAIPFKRSMRWGSNDATFARPLQWIVALFQGEVVEVRYGGVTSSNRSRGHRFEAPDSFVVSGSTYEDALRERSVVVDPAQRRAKIVEEGERLAAEVGGRLLARNDLVDEITQLVEKPVPLLGSFDRRFLEIPEEVLISEMEQHQRYLPVVDADGKLMPHFVVVANTSVEDTNVSLEGYRRVITARFEDGAFFFSEDQKTPLVERVDRLKNVLFHRALGSVYAKVERIAALGGWLAGQVDSGLDLSDFDQQADLHAQAVGPNTGKDLWKLLRAAFLMKADLTTQMVFEFPDLQGVMGAHYARRTGEPQEVAEAIEHHYLPRGADDDLPTSTYGAVLGIADRLDSIAGIFSTGKGPTGTADPFGLRRATLGIIHILQGRDWHLSLFQAIERSIALVAAREGAKNKKSPEEINKAVRSFFRVRLRGVMTADGVPTDVAEAVLTAGYDDPLDAHARSLALSELRKSPDFEPVAITFKRVANILKDQTPGAVEEGLLTEAVERSLHEASQRVSGKVSSAMADRDFRGAFATIAELLPVIDTFFDPEKGVMVLDEDPVKRKARVALVAEVHRIFAPLADFTKLS